MHSTELTYRRTAIAGASGFGLLVSLCDTLAGDLRRAADAERRDQIEERCNQVNHALLVIGHLEDWVHKSHGGELSKQLVCFYASLRQNLIYAQAKRSAALLEQEMTEVIAMREVWQRLELRGTNTDVDPVFGENLTYLGSGPEAQELEHMSSWSA